MPIRKCKSSSSFDIEIDEGVRQWYCELIVNIKHIYTRNLVPNSYN